MSTTSTTRKAKSDNDASTLTTPPQHLRPYVTFYPQEATIDVPPPTPTDIQIMTESCDWCMTTEAPWNDAGDLFGGEDVTSTDDSILDTPSTRGATTNNTSPKTTPANRKSPTSSMDDQVNLRPRYAMGVPPMS